MFLSSVFFFYLFSPQYLFMATEILKYILIIFNQKQLVAWGYDTKGVKVTEKECWKIQSYVDVWNGKGALCNCQSLCTPRTLSILPTD